MADRAYPDQNNIHSLIAVSNADGVTPVSLWADPVTHAVVTSGGSSGGADVQYITGAAQATPTGTVSLGWDGTNVQALKTNSSGVVNTTPITSVASPLADGFSVGGNVQYTDAFNLMYNGSAWDRVRGDTTNGLFVNVKSSVLPTGSALDATLTGGTQQTKLTDGTNIANIGAVAGKNGLYIMPNSATGSAVPANAFYMGLNGTGNLIGANGVSSIADGINGVGTLSVGADIFNGTNWDRMRSNEAVTLLASAARTTTQTSADLVNYNGKSALIVTLDMTVVGTGSVTVTIDRKDVASGKYVNMLTGAAITTNGTNVYRIGPEIVAVANSIAQDYIGRTFRIVVTANNANSATYSVGYDLVRG